MEDIKTRKGCFEISHRELFEDEEVTKAVMANMIIVRAESMHIRDTIEYYAYSNLFRSLKAGEEVPKYLIVVTKDSDGTIHINAREIKERQ